ncbi:hypothetical protein [Paracoccus seriniphilus]|uniref:Uncharacterized protein n=1 Tax=Paracoccus seriniphilus TaxID=184748 RepID=A0A239PLR5_9RHOB|nr:hypothetical protein [Paracoccus seriniphilus]WCR13663.1 hypothetical protein JHW44_12180 [Paracoccus seriniphilus]SNT68741.1 hypothetical protein SAMN05444959_101301 [Paracoccus seriniphilus]
MAERAPTTLAEADPKNLIRESFAIEGIGIGECRSIFLDWALSLPDGQDQILSIRFLLNHYAPKASSQDQSHPMVTVLIEGAQAHSSTARRRGGRAARMTDPG